MRRSHISGTTLLLVALALASTGCGSADSDGSDEESVLLAIDGRSANTTADGEQWLVTLAEVSPHAVFMDERPGRNAGLVATEIVVAEWAELGFGSDPPNAFLSGSNHPPVPVEIVEQPTYDTSAGTLSVKVVLVGGYVGGDVPSVLDHPLLVIDSSTAINSDLLDLTVAGVSLTGTIGDTGYGISAPSGEVNSGDAIAGPGCQPWLACEQSGLFNTDNQGVVQIDFDNAIDVSALYLMGLTTDFDGSQGSVLVEHDNGSLTLQSDPSADPSTAGFLSANVSLSGITFLRFVPEVGPFTVGGVLSNTN